MRILFHGLLLRLYEINGSTFTSQDVPIPFSSLCGHIYIRYQIYSVIRVCFFDCVALLRRMHDNRYQPPLVSFHRLQKWACFVMINFNGIPRVAKKGTQISNVCGHGV